MKKKLIFFLIFFVIVFFLFYFKSYFGFNDNTFIVTVDSKVDLNKVKIYKGFFPTDNLKREFFTKRRLGNPIFKCKKLQNIESDYGENDFIFLYSDKFYFKFRHNKTNNRQGDSYHFELKKSGKELILFVEIKGTDDLKIEEKLIPIQ